MGIARADRIARQSAPVIECVRATVCVFANQPAKRVFQVRDGAVPSRPNAYLSQLTTRRQLHRKSRPRLSPENTRRQPRRDAFSELLAREVRSRA